MAFVRGSGARLQRLHDFAWGGLARNLSGRARIAGVDRGRRANRVELRCVRPSHGVRPPDQVERLRRRVAERGCGRLLRTTVSNRGSGASGRGKTLLSTAACDDTGTVRRSRVRHRERCQKRARCCEREASSVPAGQHPRSFTEFSAPFGNRVLCFPYGFHFAASVQFGSTTD